MHHINTRLILGRVILSLTCPCAIGGCAGSASAPQSAGAEATAPAARPPKPAASAGPVVKKNVTTQAEMTAMFGRPINAHAAGDGTETWVYERLRGTDVAGDAPQDRNYSAFFGAAFAGPA